MKDKNLVEKYDDNPGAYFGMLVEGFEDKEESLKEGIDKQLVQKLYSMWFSKEQAEWLAKNAKDYAESLAYGHTTTDDLIEAEEYVNSKMKKQEAIKEDKFIPQDKMSKKAQKELNDKKRGTWGNTNPVTRVQPNKKAYDRKRDKKVVEESKKLKEDVSVTEEDDYDRFYSDEWWYIGPELSEYGSVEYPYLTKTLKDVDSNDELYLKVEVPYSDSDNDFEDYEPFIDSNFGLKWFGKGSRQFKYAVKKICDYLNSEGIEVNITEERFKRI